MNFYETLSSPYYLYRTLAHASTINVYYFRKNYYYYYNILLPFGSFMSIKYSKVFP